MQEMNELKGIISQMGNQILIINEELQNAKQYNIAEIVKVVLSILDKPQASAVTWKYRKGRDLSLL